MKTKLLCSLLLVILSIGSLSAQRSDVKITVKWPSKSFENKIEIYNTANDLLKQFAIITLLSTTQVDAHDEYGAKYDLGCVTNGNNYYIKIYDSANNGWASGSYVSLLLLELKF